MSEALGIDIPFAGHFGKRPLPGLIEPMKTNTTASPLGGLAPAGEFHGGSFGVSGTPPGAVCMTARPLVYDIFTRAWKQTAFVRRVPSRGRSA